VNYRELQELYQRLSPQGFTVLAFPCNQFGGQEPGTAQEILDFGSSKYGVTFPLFEKVDVNGPNTHPLWAHLKKEKGELFGSDIKWNFAKFLVGRRGQVLERYGPQTPPSDIEGDVTKALAEAPPAVKGVVTPTGASATTEQPTR